MDPLTKKDLDEYQEAILEAVGAGFKKAEEERNRIIDLMEEGFKEAKTEREELRMAIRDLTTTIDQFIKRLTNLEDELAVVSAKLEKVTSFIKEKFGVEISAQ